MNTATSHLQRLPRVADVLLSAAQSCTTVPLPAGERLLVAERPGSAWNTTTHRRVYDALVPVSTQSFGADMSSYWEQRSKEGYLERIQEFLVVEDVDGSFVGWSGFHVLPHDRHTIIYIDSTGMVPGRQSRGVMRTVLKERIDRAVAAERSRDRPIYLTARSESPIFYRLMRGLEPASALYPDGTVPVPLDVQACALDLATWLGQRDILDPLSLKLPDAYDSIEELYGELPTTGDVRLDAMFRDQLGRLDAFLLVSRVD